MDAKRVITVAVCLVAVALVAGSTTLLLDGDPQAAKPLNQSPGPPGHNRDAEPPGAPPAGKPAKRGLVLHERGAFEGYTLFAPLRSTTTYLVDMEGRVVHTWASDAPPGHSVYLLGNGNLLRCEHDLENETFHGSGLGGRMKEYAWDGTIVWEYVYSDDRHIQHHDIEPLPSGNILMIAWERRSRAEALAAGCDPELLRQDEIWPDHIVEVKPTRPRGGEIVWEWHVWDHLVQDYDPSRRNYGVVADHPELIDVNYREESATQLPPEELRRLGGLGYVSAPRNVGPRSGPRHGSPDWNHTNSIAYNAELDQTTLSVLGFHELWVIDHGTTTEEAAGHTGGRRGKGGDLLYRWGNPEAWQAGELEDRQLFAQHDVPWIEKGMRGAGHFLLFNNGRGRPDGRYSSVDEIAPPISKSGVYTRAPDAPFGPDRPAWVFAGSEGHRFHSGHISGAQRLPNGNTLICSGEDGRFLEVTGDGRLVWEYLNPFGGDAPRPPRGRRPGIGPRRPGAPGGGPPPGRPGRRPGWGRRRPGPGGRRGETNAVFRATRLSPDHPGLAGKKLEPIKPDRLPPSVPPRAQPRHTEPPAQRDRVEH